ncbi:MAG: hypothetical protein WA840_20120 [Caulobacteraceae bacterium]
MTAGTEVESKNELCCFAAYAIYFHSRRIVHRLGYPKTRVRTAKQRVEFKLNDPALSILMKYIQGNRIVLIYKINVNTRTHLSAPRTLLHCSSDTAARERGIKAM